MHSDKQDSLPTKFDQSWKIKKVEDNNDIYNIINASIKHIERTSRPIEEGMAASRA